MLILGTLKKLLADLVVPLPTIYSGLGWLNRVQEKNGSWSSPDILQVPRTSRINPYTAPVRTFKDANNVFTTATVLQSLALVKDLM
jgi:hypothetical protein